MTLSRAFYQLIWLDSYEEQGGTRFYATSDSSALALAGRMAELSGCQLDSFWKVQELGPVSTHDPAAGSNIQDKTWFLYKSTKNKVIKLSLPAMDRALLEQPRRRTKIDRIVGASALTSNNGTAVRVFVKGVNNYGLRKRDKEPG